MKKVFILALINGWIFCSVGAQINNPKQLPFNWKTNLSKSIVALKDITIATDRDIIPTLDYPKFIQKSDPTYDYFELEPVIAITVKGESKAYPLRILTLYELANDSIGGVQFMVTYCPMCNAAMTFNRKVVVDGKETLLDFSISGMLMHNDMIMYDKQTETLWEQMMGQAIVGDLAGTDLKFMGALIVSVEEYFDTYPNGKILSTEGLNLFDEKSEHRPFYHLDHDAAHLESQYYLPEKLDSRLPPLERVLDIHVGEHTTIYPFSKIAEHKVINDEYEGEKFVIFFHPKTVSVLDEDNLEQSHAVGTATAFSSRVDTMNLTFKKKGKYFIDEETGSSWDIMGLCHEGKMKGKQLYIMPHSNHFAFAYLAFFPDSEIYGQ